MCPLKLIVKAGGLPSASVPIYSKRTTFLLDPPFANRRWMVLFYLVSSLKWPTVPIILSGSLSLAPRILSGELWCLSCVQRAFSALVPNSPHCMSVSPQEHHSNHHSHTLNGEIRFAEGEGQNTRPADVKQTSNESEGFDSECWWKADGHFWRLQDGAGGDWEH